MAESAHTDSGKLTEPSTIYWSVRGNRWGHQPYEDLWEGTFGLYARDNAHLAREVSAEEAERLRLAGKEIFTLWVTNHTQGTRVGLFRDEDHVFQMARVNMRAKIKRFEI